MPHFPTNATHAIEASPDVEYPMYSESDLQSAVDAGVLTAASADALRNHVASQRATPAVDEENFRLLTGFNDIFVVIAIALLLTALGWIGGGVTPVLGSLAVAVASWGLAEFFTRKRRMALPSIVLVLAFSGGIFATMVGFLVKHGEDIFGPKIGETTGAALIAVMALVTAGATWLHWKRFMVPITVAAGTAALAATAEFSKPGVSDLAGDAPPPGASGGVGSNRRCLRGVRSAQTSATRVTAIGVAAEIQRPSVAGIAAPNPILERRRQRAGVDAGVTTERRPAALVARLHASPSRVAATSRR